MRPSRFEPERTRSKLDRKERSLRSLTTFQCGDPSLVLIHSNAESGDIVAQLRELLLQNLFSLSHPRQSHESAEQFLSQTPKFSH